MKNIGHIIKAGFITCLLAVSGTAMAKTYDISSSDNPAIITPTADKVSLDVVIEKVDGKGKRVFSGWGDNLRLDAGSHNLEIRLQHTPARGSGFALGAIDGLILRAFSTKSVVTQITLDVLPGHAYEIRGLKNESGGFDIIAIDVTDQAEVDRQSFISKGKKLKRVL